MGKRIGNLFVSFVIRAFTGMALIFFIEQYAIPEGSSVHVGLNLLSFLVSGTLGIPGVCMLYGIMLYSIL